MPPFLDGKANRVVNPFDKVAIAANKLKTLEVLDGHEAINIPRYTSSRDTAVDWVQTGSVVLCRTKLSAHSGEGIVVSANEAGIVDAPLYVEYIKKKSEFRVHVVGNNVVDVQEKRRRQDHDGEPNFTVRNYGTGWVYCREDISEPEGLRTSAVEAVQRLGLDFGAVDIIYNQHRNKCYVLEVNTACGLEGSTVASYSDALYNLAFS